jgi:hypothetical protein
MLRNIKIFRFLIAALFAVNLATSSLRAESLSGNSASFKKYNLSVCALFKNEAKYLREWIEYHRVVGVDHFYLYDNGSTDCFRDVLKSYIREGFVTLISWPDCVPPGQDGNAAHWALSTQTPAYENAARYFGVKETEWLAFLDVDEYLVPVNAATVSRVLLSYQDSPGLQLNADCFDASQIDIFPGRELLIATATLTGEPPQNIQKSVEKIIFKPECHTTFTWPPFKCNFKDGRIAAQPEKTELRINKYVNRFKGALHFGKRQEKLHADSRLLTEREKTELLQVGYEIEDKERVIARFEPELRKRMGLDTGWNW